MVNQESLKQAKNLIETSKNILVLPSSPADGDSLGSALSLMLVLQRLGKTITVVNEEQVPDTLRFLPHINAIKNVFAPVRDLIVTIDTRAAKVKDVRHEIEPDKINIVITPEAGHIQTAAPKITLGPPPYDLIITVDAGDTVQFGSIYENNAELFHTIPVINIDHHISNSHFGKVNVVDVMASSATILVMQLIELLGAHLIDPDIATLLLAGLITDTGSFQNPNTNPDSFEIAARLIELGARQQEIIQHVYKTKELSTLKLWGKVLSKIQYDESHKLVWSTISKEDLMSTQSKPEHSEGIIDELMTNAPGAEIVLLLKERDGEVSGSVRTLNPSIDASVLAARFGGGGHTQAAGFKIEGKSLADAENAVIQELKKIQESRLGITNGGARPAPTARPFPEPMDMR